MNVLFVDDGARNLDTFEEQITLLGHGLSRVAGGIEALRRIDGGEVDVVMLDVATVRRLKLTVDELAQRAADLERQQVLERELTQFIVHDLKNPIGVAQANIQYVLGQLDGNGEEDACEALRDAEDGVRRLLSLVEDLLSSTRLEQGKMPLRKKPCPLRPLLDEVERRQSRSAHERGVALEVVSDGSSELLADPPVLQRALENLVDNALRHTPRAGRVRLAARVNGGATFTVSNTGRSVPAGERERIFEKFARASGRVDRVGPGLALYFCRRVAEAHGGSLRVTETPEWPASFVLDLPA